MDVFHKSRQAAPNTKKGRTSPKSCPQSQTNGIRILAWISLNITNERYAHHCQCLSQCESCTQSQSWLASHSPWLQRRNCYNSRISGHGECVCVVTDALLTETAPMSGQVRYSREPRSAFTSHAVTHFVSSAYLSITGRFNFSQRVARWRIVCRWASNAI